MTRDTPPDGPKVVSLNKARKARAKADARTTANANAARFGRTRAQRALQDEQALQAARLLDAHKRDPQD
jgi:hypothetical protein